MDRKSFLIASDMFVY